MSFFTWIEVLMSFVDTFVVVGGAVLAVVGGIITLTFFYRSLWWFSGDSKPGINVIGFDGVLKNDAIVTVHFVCGEKFERVRLVGFTNTDSTTVFPYQLRSLVILEDEQKQRYFVRAKFIRMIVVGPEANAAGFGVPPRRGKNEIPLGRSAH
jgi:hypothetical protein